MIRRDRRVLIVDDNPINLGILEECLSDHFRLKFASSGPEAVRIAESFQPGFVLLDVMMPGMDGLETCRQLRTIPGGNDSVIVMVSAKAMPSEQAAGLQAGADDYITKPFDEVELLELLRSYSSPPDWKAECATISDAVDSDDMPTL